eukprot:582125-Amphidinium_carterae.1
MVLPGLRTHEEVKVASSIRTRYSAAASQSQLIIGEVEDLSNQAYVPNNCDNHISQQQSVQSKYKNTD